MTLDGATWGIPDAAQLIAEIDREFGVREAHYPELVRKGRLSQAEADRLVEIIRDIRADLLHAFAPVTEGELRGPFDRDDCRVTWPDKIRWLDRERADCRDRLPELVKKGRVTANDAQRRQSAIVMLRRLYWNRMFMWLPPEGPGRDYLAARHASARSGSRDKTAEIRSSEGARVYREHVRNHLEAVELEELNEGAGSMAA